MGLRMKNFSIMGFQWRIWFLGGIHEKPVYRRKLPENKRGTWTVFRFKRGLVEKEGGFEGGRVDIPMHTMVYEELAQSCLKRKLCKNLSRRFQEIHHKENSILLIHLQTKGLKVCLSKCLWDVFQWNLKWFVGVCF